MITCCDDKFTKLKEWNSSQAKLWFLLFSNDLVYENDFIEFKKFSLFFNKFVDEHKRLPTFIETVYFFRANSL